MKVRCPHCGEWVDIRLPQSYQTYTATVNCRTCGHPVTVEIGVKAGPIVGPSETKGESE